MAYNVGLVIRALREDRDMRQFDLAVAAGMTPAGISQIETGKRSPNAKSLEKIATALGVEVADLYPKAQAPLLVELPSERGAEIGANLRIHFPAETIGEAWPETPALLEGEVGHAHLNQTVPELIEGAQGMSVPEILILVHELHEEVVWLQRYLLRTMREERKTREGRTIYRERQHKLGQTRSARLLALADLAEEKAIKLPPDKRREALEKLDEGLEHIAEESGAPA